MKNRLYPVKDMTMGVDPRTYKETLAHWSSGVTVVTSLADGHPVGITASSFTSLSLDPPQVLISINKKLFTHGAVHESGRFAVSILRAEQVEWGKRFAGMIPEIEDRFAGIETFTAASGCPILSEALAWVDCEVRRMYDGEDHTIFVGEGMAAGVGRTPAGSEDAAAAPLLYYNRQWRALSDEPVVERHSSAL